MGIRSTRCAGSCFAFVAAIAGSTPAAAGQAVNQVRGITVTSVTLNPSSVAGGNGVTGTVTISEPAPAAGFRVQLGSSHPQIALPASQLMIARGQVTGQFAIQTFPIDQHPGTVDPNPTITISAWNADSPVRSGLRTASLTVTPAALFAIVVETPIPSGTAADATVTLSGPAPSSGVTIALTNSGPSDLTMPASVAFPPGARTASFTITPRPEIYDRSYVIQGRRSSFDTKQAQLFVRIPEPERLLCLGKPQHIPDFTGGSDVHCTVKIDGRAPFDYPVTLESSDQEYAAVEKFVTIPKGEWETGILVQTKPVVEPRIVKLAGTQRGKTVSQTFRLVGARLKKVAVAPDPVTGGQLVNVTVTLTGPTAVPVSVTVDSDNPSIFQVLVPIPVGVGQEQSTTQVSTSEIEQDKTVRATARLGTGSTQTEFVIKRTPRPDFYVGIMTRRPVLQFWVRNVGEVAAPATTVKIDYFNVAGDMLGSTTVPVPPLPRQSTAYLTAENGNASKWKFYVDPLNEIKESNETNNAATVN